MSEYDTKIEQFGNLIRNYKVNTSRTDPEFMELYNNVESPDGKWNFKILRDNLARLVDPGIQDLTDTEVLDALDLGSTYPRGQYIKEAWNDFVGYEGRPPPNINYGTTLPQAIKSSISTGLGNGFDSASNMLGNALNLVDTTMPTHPLQALASWLKEGQEDDTFARNKKNALVEADYPIVSNISKFGASLLPEMPIYALPGAAVGNVAKMGIGLGEKIVPQLGKLVGKKFNTKAIEKGVSSLRESANSIAKGGMNIPVKTITNGKGMLSKELLNRGKYAAINSAIGDVVLNDDSSIASVGGAGAIGDALSMALTAGGIKAKPLLNKIFSPKEVTAENFVNKDMTPEELAKAEIYAGLYQRGIPIEARHNPKAGRFSRLFGALDGEAAQEVTKKAVQSEVNKAGADYLNLSRLNNQSSFLKQIDNEITDAGTNYEGLKKLGTFIRDDELRNDLDKLRSEIKGTDISKTPVPNVIVNTIDKTSDNLYYTANDLVNNIKMLRQEASTLRSKGNKQSATYYERHADILERFMGRKLSGNTLDNDDALVKENFGKYHNEYREIKDKEASNTQKRLAKERKFKEIDNKLIAISGNVSKEHFDKYVKMVKKNTNVPNVFEAIDNDKSLTNMQKDQLTQAVFIKGVIKQANATDSLLSEKLKDVIARYKIDRKALRNIVKADPDIYENYVTSRERLAKAYTIRDAIDFGSGNIDARKLKDKLGEKSFDNAGDLRFYTKASGVEPELFTRQSDIDPALRNLQSSLAMKSSLWRMLLRSIPLSGYLARKSTTRDWQNVKFPSSIFKYAVGKDGKKLQKGLVSNFAITTIPNYKREKERRDE